MNTCETDIPDGIRMTKHGSPSLLLETGIMLLILQYECRHTILLPSILNVESMPFPFVSGKIVVYLPPFQQTTGTYANRTNRT